MAENSNISAEVTRSCETCEWLQEPQRACAEANPWRTLPPERWCGRWRQAERLCGGKDSRGTVVIATVPTDQECDVTITARAAPTSAEESSVSLGWRPVETAPRDNSPIIVAQPLAYPGAWTASTMRLIPGEYDFRPGSVWARLPAPTEARSANSEGEA